MKVRVMKTRRSAFFILSTLIITSFAFVEHAKAHGSKDFQVFLRTGVIDGHYNGTFSGSFRVDMAFDLGTEYYVAPDSSVLVRFVEALGSPDSVPFYTYAGMGFRHYIGARGSFMERSDDSVLISSRPKLRTYVAGEFGLAQVIVKTFGPVVQSVANMVETGLNAGAIYQVSENVGFEVQVGGTLGYGISSTSVNGNTLRFLVGGTHYF